MKSSISYTKDTLRKRSTHSVRKIFTVGLIFILGMLNTETFAQCAMCRATLENNVSNGNIGIAAGINFGILYLFVTPYLAVATIAIFWYRTSRRNAASLNGAS